VVDDERRDEPRDVPRHPDVRLSRCNPDDEYSRCTALVR
jgi:hypothetical protein